MMRQSRRSRAPKAVPTDGAEGRAWALRQLAFEAWLDDVRGGKALRDGRAAATAGEDATPVAVPKAARRRAALVPVPVLRPR